MVRMDICLRWLLRKPYSRAMKFCPFPFGHGWRLFMVVIVLATGLTACGGGGDASSSPAPLDSASVPVPVAVKDLPSAPTPAVQDLPVIPTPAAQNPTAASAVPAPTQTATSLSSPDPVTSCSIPNLRQSALQQINAARAAGHTCGGEALPPTGALVWNDLLFSAAAKHSLDMAQRNYFSHDTPEGIDFAQRFSAEGYGWSAAGENIAGGQGSLDEVMAVWLASDGHCRNIMQPVFADVALACVSQPGTTLGTYWTMELGRR
jgi:uncharacterized protein YkwD